VKAAALTTRGGAYKDLGHFAEAEECGLAAIEVDESKHHPYTLLGAVCYGTGQYGRGDQFFALAAQRGASARETDGAIRGAVRAAKPEGRGAAARHLLHKDATRYAWARAHLPPEKG
jgi:hypothetical protein